MTDETLQQLWENYQDAWSEASSEKRDQLLHSSLAQDVASAAPTVTNAALIVWCPLSSRSNLNLRVLTSAAHCSGNNMDNSSPLGRCSTVTIFHW